MLSYLTDRVTYGPVRWLIAALIVVATILFVLGVAVERGSEAGEVADLPPLAATSGAAPAAGEAHPAEVNEAGETNDAGEAAEVAPGDTPAPPGEGAGREQGRELILGVDLENPGVVAAIVLGWGVLLGALFFLGRGGLLLLALAAGAATLFDLAEVARQFTRGNMPTASLAIAVTLAHAGLFVLVAWTLFRGHRPPVAPAP